MTRNGSLYTHPGAYIFPLKYLLFAIVWREGIGLGGHLTGLNQAKNSYIIVVS